MDPLAWALFAVAALGALALVGYLYYRRETLGRGRRLLLGLRWAALSVLVLLLFDPVLPVPGAAAGPERTHVLLDASLSMTLPAEPGDTVSRWQRAVDDARSSGSNVVVFGDAPRVVPSDQLDTLRPSAARSTMLPALRGAAEAGARRVVVFTDGAIEDAADVRRIARELGTEIDVRRVGDDGVGNLALSEVQAPGWAEAGEPLEIGAGVTASGAAPDTATVVLRRDGREVARATVTTPGAGRVASTSLSVTPEAPEGADSDGGGLVRYDLAIAESDATDADNERSVYVFVSDEPSGVALVSFEPDWEPRFLHPVLEESLGLPVQGYLSAGDERYIRMGAGADAGRPTDEEEVRRAVERADLVVLHGVGENAPEWAHEAMGGVQRLLVFPSGEAESLDLPISLAPGVTGEWYPAAELPASPVASFLTTIEPGELPPLRDARLFSPRNEAWVPLELRRDRRGRVASALAAGENGDRRWAVALAEGYWRWAFRGGESRQAYRRLWSAVGGWLVAGQGDVALDAIRPAERVTERGSAVRWRARGLDADSIAVELTDAEGAVALDTVLPVRDDGAVSAPPVPGHYRYTARAFAGDQAVASADGPLSVARYSPEFARVAGEITGAEQAGGLGGRFERAGQPLHSSPWPYLLLVLLLCGEWILRRRWGLR